MSVFSSQSFTPLRQSSVRLGELKKHSLQGLKDHLEAYPSRAVGSDSTPNMSGECRLRGHPADCVEAAREEGMQ